MSNYDRKLWERLCKAEEPVAAQTASVDGIRMRPVTEWIRPAEEASRLDEIRRLTERIREENDRRQAQIPVAQTEWRANTGGIYDQLRRSGQIGDVNQPAPAIDWGQLQASLYSLARAQEYRHRRALEALESDEAQRRYRESYWTQWQRWSTQPIDPQETHGRIGG